MKTKPIVSQQPSETMFQLPALMGFHTVKKHFFEGGRSHKLV